MPDTARPRSHDSNDPAAPLPAVVFVDPATAGLEVVALTLLDRLLVGLHRAGCAPITVVSAAPLLPLRRTRALGIPFDVGTRPPSGGGRAVVTGTGLWAGAAEWRRLRERGGRLVGADGTPLAAGVLEGVGADWRARLDAEPPVAVEAACPVADAAGARRAADRLWAGLTSASDGRVDRWFNRPVGRWLLSRWLVHTPVTPNQVSIAATVLGVVAGAMFASTRQPVAVAAAVLFQVAAVVDCVDGDVARSVFKESPLGKWIDLVGDQVVHAAVFAGIALGSWLAGGGALSLGLGAAAVMGGLLSFVVVLRGMRRPGGLEGSLQRLIDGATNRDFSVLVLGLALVDRLGWFLWLAAVGSHGFWLAALALQLRADRAPRRP